MFINKTLFSVIPLYLLLFFTMFLSLASCKNEVLKNSATIIIRDGHVIMTYYNEEGDAIHDWDGVKRFLRVLLANHSQKEILVIIEKVDDPRPLAPHAVRRVIRYLRREGASLDIRDERAGLRRSVSPEEEAF